MSKEVKEEAWYHFLKFTLSKFIQSITQKNKSYIPKSYVQYWVSRTSWETINLSIADNNDIINYQVPTCMELPHIKEQNELHVSKSEVAPDRIQNKKIYPYLWRAVFWDRVPLCRLGTLCCNSLYRPSLPPTQRASPASWVLGCKVCTITAQLENIVISIGIVYSPHRTVWCFLRTCAYKNTVCVYCTHTTRLLSHPASDLSSLLTNKTFSLFTSYTHVILFLHKKPRPSNEKKKHPVLVFIDVIHLMTIIFIYIYFLQMT